MKTLFSAFAVFVVTAGAALAYDLPRTCPIGNTAPAQSQGQQKGKRLGPKDGSGPIHQPGTGGGTGVGRRAGRR
jgi:hypothetical protein